jgi:hypothetical protein
MSGWRFLGAALVVIIVMWLLVRLAMVLIALGHVL